MEKKFDDKWLDETRTVSRRVMGQIIADELNMVFAELDRVFGDKPQTCASFKELFTTFGATIAAKVFVTTKKDGEDSETH